MPKYLNNKQSQVLQDIQAHSKQLSGKYAQVHKHEVARDAIKKQIKKFKKNRNKKVKRIIPGNIIDEVYAKDIIKDLAKKLEEIEIGIESLNQQIEHEEDHLETLYIKAWREIFKRKVPKDVLEE